MRTRKEKEKKGKEGGRRSGFRGCSEFDSLHNGEIRVFQLALDLEKRTVFDFRWNVAGPMGVEITLPKNAPAKFAYMRLFFFARGPKIEFIWGFSYFLWKSGWG